MKTLEINKNYGGCFGCANNQKIIYKGDDNWLFVQDDQQQQVKNESITKNALEYINRPSIKMGSF